jgi:hypothetical protein
MGNKAERKRQKEKGVRGARCREWSSGILVEKIPQPTVKINRKERKGGAEITKSINSF